MAKFDKAIKVLSDEALKISASIFNDHIKEKILDKLAEEGDTEAIDAKKMMALMDIILETDYKNNPDKKCAEFQEFINAIKLLRGKE